MSYNLGMEKDFLQSSESLRKRLIYLNIKIKKLLFDNIAKYCS